MTSNVTKYCPGYIETKKGHMTQTGQGLRSTNPEGRTSTPTTPLEELLPPVASNEVQIRAEQIRKLHTNYMGRST